MLRNARAIRWTPWTALTTRARFLSAYRTEVVGASGTQESRLAFYKDHARLSPWHDIPLRPSGNAARNVFNFVNEIPKGARSKMEIATNEATNPIKQDVKKGNLRFYHFDSLVNYGCIPQTWEDPAHVDASTHHGDNDPVDVCEIGSRVAAVGDVYPVKVIGVLGMIDEGETDWKVIAIALDDPLAETLNDIDDLHAHAPNTVTEIRNWFRDYKIPDGKPPSVFAFDGQAKPRDFAVEVIEQTHTSWKQLVGSPAKAAKLWTPPASAA
ncbi:Aste57867_19382 [Aphanomyces stellatus]|uniref:inorganic diphosphatase n=1 Tax=Aphanomyces stellatus TaxID=120398 RepID=A0A485LEC6_9STRA|nr:hypothetical protein As57867_019318 [Aphanomyces stellatus]VFT96096.1 Aste57867_19382 [Aphanomyces stellatus]